MHHPFIFCRIGIIITAHMLKGRHQVKPGCCSVTYINSAIPRTQQTAVIHMPELIEPCQVDVQIIKLQPGAPAQSVSSIEQGFVKAVVIGIENIHKSKSQLIIEQTLAQV